MDYLFSRDNWICRLLGHRYGRPYGQGSGVVRRTCSLDGHTVPPFEPVRQERDDPSGS